MNQSPQLLHYEQQLQAAFDFMRQHDDFLVVSHVSPDGDAASSTFAVGLMLDYLGKRYTLINEGSIPAKFDYMPGFNSIVNYSNDPISRNFQHVISIDCADYERIGQVSQLFTDDVQLVNIDHHPTNDGFGCINLIRCDAASTTEILFDLVMIGQVPLTLELAECIYTGLLTDTGGFRYSNTSSKVMDIVAQLLKVGVVGHLLAELLLEKLSLSHIDLLKKSLLSLSFAYEKQISWMSVTLEDIQDSKASNEDLEGLVNYPRNIEGVEVGLLFKQASDQAVKVSFRSAGKVDVAVIAKSFGGGGHVRAAGCTIAGSIEQAVDQVVREVGKALA